jgi:integrase
MLHLARARLPHMRFHDLRHTCATLLLTKGVHLEIVSEMLIEAMGRALDAVTPGDAGGFFEHRGYRPLAQPL